MICNTPWLSSAGPKPRKRMSNSRMRRQRGKHHHIRYRIQYMSRENVEDMYPEVMEFFLAETLEMLRMEVARWNMWQKRPLSPVTVFRDYDLDFDRYKFIFEVYRLA